MSLSKEQGFSLRSEQAAQSPTRSYRERDCHALRASNDNVKTFISFTVI